MSSLQAFRVMRMKDETCKQIAGANHANQPCPSSLYMKELSFVSTYELQMFIICLQGTSSDQKWLISTSQT